MKTIYFLHTLKQLAIIAGAVWLLTNDHWIYAILIMLCLSELEVTRKVSK